MPPAAASDERVPDERPTLMASMSEHPTSPTTGRPTATSERTLLVTGLPWNADSVAAARAHVRAAAVELELPPATARQSVLAVSELVSNAIEHGTPPLELRLMAIPGGVRLEVDDASPQAPIPLAVTPTAASGRGLSIVHAVAAGWGHYPTEAGKCVWCDLVVASG
jgi:anti-sigma regulatory factor (Ser/Thr protein kinase)